MTRYYYSVKTATRTVQCRDLRAAEYIYGCNKHATIYRNGEVYKTK